DQGYHYRSCSIIDLLAHPAVAAGTANAQHLPVADVAGPFNKDEVSAFRVSGCAKGSEHLRGSRHEPARPVRIYMLLCKGIQVSVPRLYYKKCTLLFVSMVGGDAHLSRAIAGMLMALFGLPEIRMWIVIAVQRQATGSASRQSRLRAGGWCK